MDSEKDFFADETYSVAIVNGSAYRDQIDETVVFLEEEHDCILEVLKEGEGSLFLREAGDFPAKRIVFRFAKELTGLFLQQTAKFFKEQYLIKLDLEDVHRVMTDRGRFYSIESSVAELKKNIQTWIPEAERKVLCNQNIIFGIEGDVDLFIWEDINSTLSDCLEWDGNDVLFCCSYKEEFVDKVRVSLWIATKD